MTNTFSPSKDKPGIYDGWLADSYELGNGKISAVWFGGTRYVPEKKCRNIHDARFRFICSECGAKEVEDCPNYCPRCGAKVK